MFTKNAKQQLFVLSVLGAGLAVLPMVFAQVGSHPSGNAAALFQSKCAACHTIGGGARVGPDLARVRNFKPSIVRQNVERMQANSGPLTPAQIDELTAYLTGCAMPQRAGKPAATGRRATAAPAPSASMPPAGQPMGPGDWNSVGAQLYSGRAPFSNGGMACMVCHKPEGGGSGPSLSEIAEEKRGPRLFAFLQMPENRAMRQAYAAHPITWQESQALSNYFASLSQGFGGNGRFSRGEREDRGDDD